MGASKAVFEPCGRDRHHYPHLTQLRPLEEISYDPATGVLIDLERFEPVVCPGAGSDAMEVPEPEPYIVEGVSYGAEWTETVDDLGEALGRLSMGVECGQWAVRAIVRPDGHRIEGKELERAYVSYEMRTDDWKQLEG